MTVKKGYRLLDHTADFGLEIEAPDRAALYEQAALALFDVMLERRPKAGGRSRAIALTIRIEGQDRADLLVNWLRELLYLFNGKEQVLSAVDVQAINETSLSARITVEPFAARRHRVQNEIKAVTYHQIQVGPVAHGWLARVIFDT